MPSDPSVEEEDGQIESDDSDELVDAHGRGEPSEDGNYFDFLRTFFRSRGGPQLLLVSFLFSFGMGCTVGVIPDVMSDRYARIYHGYNGTDSCAAYDRVDKPDGCQAGADAAQDAATWSNLAKNLLTLLFNSIVGSLSDLHGRKGIFVLGVFLTVLSPAALCIIQMNPKVTPFWFYALDSICGIVNWMTIPFAMLTDLMPKAYRGPSFGLYLGVFYLGYSMSPSLPLVMSHYAVSIVGFCLVALACVCAFFLPETLPQHIAEHNRNNRPDGVGLFYLITRPLMEMEILNRNLFLRLLAVGSFLSGIVYASDVTLVIYYAEDELNVRDTDLAYMFCFMGVFGIIVQVFLLKPLISLLGEKGALILSFISGTFHNLFYGTARNKVLFCVAISLSQLTKINFPILSSLASASVAEYEQGRIQGALFALSALANAVGPMMLEYIYSQTENTLGAGFMFVVAALLYFIGTLFVSCLPTKGPEQSESEIEPNGMEEPLLDPESDPDPA